MTYRLRHNADGSWTLRRPDGASRAYAALPDVNAAMRAPLVAAMPADAPAEDRTPFWAVLMLLGVETQEDPEFNRLFGEAVPRREFPMPLWWEDSSAHGAGEFALVGRVDEFHQDGFPLLATGSFDNTLEAAQRALDGIANGADAISVDFSFEEPTEIQCTEYDPDDPGWCLRQRLYAPRIAIGGATLCGLGAFAQARISLTGYPSVTAEAAPPVAEPPPCEDCEEDSPEVIILASVQAVAASLALPVYPASHFRPPPDLPADQPLTITADGHVYGRACPPTECHRGNPTSCSPPPVDPDFSEFLLTPVTLDDGTRVMTGPLTFRGDAHVATPGLSIASVRAAYDNSATVAGLVTMGRDERGDWYSGVIRPGLSEDELWEITACGQVSGHWQPVGRATRLAALHIVPTPGFPQRGRSIAASGAPVLIPGPDRLAYVERRLDALAAQVAALQPLTELYGLAGDQIVASLGGGVLTEHGYLPNPEAVIDAIRLDLATRRGA